MTYHIPVLLKETMELLNLRKEGFWVDATGGGGGHSEAILEKIAPGGKLVFIDRDAEAISEAEKRLERFEGHVIFVHDDFGNLGGILSSMNIPPVNGMLFDLGVSSRQIDSADRGFSFSADGPLDMRMDKGRRLTAQEVVNGYGENELAKIFFMYGEERHSKRIARMIAAARPLETTKELADIIGKATGERYKIGTLARIFQALRIEVNGELDALKKAVPEAILRLAPGGRIAVLSYHSLEDRIVKHAFAREAAGCICDKRLPQCVCEHKRKLKIVVKKPVCASDEEIKNNPRARSAKLRAAERVADA